MGLQSKMTVYAAIVGVLVLMGGIIWFASLDNIGLQQVEIELTGVELQRVNNVENQAKFEVTFLVKNPSEKTLTISIIDYQLYGDDTLLGSGLYTTADIALPGRALFYPGAEIALKNIFVLDKTAENSEIYELAISEEITNFDAVGRITSQTSWSEVDKDFETGY